MAKGMKKNKANSRPLPVEDKDRVSPPSPFPKGYGEAGGYVGAGGMKESGRGYEERGERHTPNPSKEGRSR